MHISQQKCWTTMLTTYTTRKMSSKAASSFPNRGSHALENTFSPMLRFDPPRICDHGKLSFHILLPVPRVTSTLFLSNSFRPLRLRMQKRVVGSQPFPESSAWRCPLTARAVRVPFSIPRILTCHQVSSHFFYRRSILILSQLDLFIPSPRRPLRDRSVVG